MVHTLSTGGRLVVLLIMMSRSASGPRGESPHLHLHTHLSVSHGARRAAGRAYFMPRASMLLIASVCVASVVIPASNATQTSAWAPNADAVSILTSSSRQLPLTRDATGTWHLPAALESLLHAGEDFRMFVTYQGTTFERTPPRCLALSEVYLGYTRCRYTAVRSTSEVASRPPQLVKKPQDAIIYELHVPSFTPGGTLVSARSRLPYLAAMGVNTIQLMPVHTDAFPPGWGYTPIHLFGTSTRLGGLAALRDFVAAAGARGIRVIVDVVLSHLDANSLLFRFDGASTFKEGLAPQYCPLNHFKRPMVCPAGDYFYQDADAITPWGPRFDFSREQVT